ncbi:helix-turn-helix transcriptional regulator [Paracoccus sp. MC1854]|uniref:helix-turn-helix transcriptional regulator n=1 Tax=Paracoccus sp. MC1854 TaxID=2760306 RepID=UPI0016002CC5|nr:helix-turn-helix transcriptional regulator [Paracoccus sp. MC1854]MBB1492937.1 helix-turn-helix transcriptional regulator [Paracoccus sp. MC1854]
MTALIYSALLDTSCWEKFINMAAAEIGGARMQIHGWTDTAGSNVGATTGYDPEMILRYHRGLGRLNPWTKTIIRAPVGVVLPSQELCTVGELKRTVFYEEWVRPQENISVGAGVVIGRTPSGPFMFGGNVRERDQENKQPKLIELMGRLTPHLTLAWRLAQTMFEPRLRFEAADEGAGSSGAALILLRHDRTVAFTDEAGERLLAAGGLCRVDRLGRFALRSELAERALARGLSELIRSDGPLALRVPESNEWPSLYLVGLDYTRVQDWPLASLLNLPQRSILCVIECSSSAKAASRLGIFGLTAAEQEVAEAIAQGKATALIAKQRSVSLATVRSQVQAIYAKCGIHNRAALTALVLGTRCGN